MGYFDFNASPQPQGYTSFLTAAVKSLVFDPWRKVQFAVVTARKVAHKLKMNRPSTILLYRWNATIEYPALQGAPPMTDALIRWVHETVDKTGALVEWITPSGIKSKSMDIGVRRTKATFILFTPRSLILGISPYVDVVRSIIIGFAHLE